MKNPLRIRKPEAGPSFNLETIEKVYTFWGHHPLLYAISDYVTFIGRPGFIRGHAVDALRVRPGGKVLELGCGTGRNLGLLADRVGETGRIVAFDYSRDMLSAAGELCRKKGWRNVTLTQGDARKLEGVEGPFDSVLSVLAVSAIPGWQEALLRCREILHPGGVLSICDASLFRGPLSLVNPVVEALYRRYAAWNPARKIPEEMERVFGNVKVERFNQGTFFIAASVKQED